MTSRNGFTIVELLITIVVIGILVSITVVAYNGIQTRALNMARVSELKQWVKSYELYHASFGVFPAKPSTSIGYCLGTGFPESGTCGDVYNAPSAYRENTTLMNEIKKISTLPSGPRGMVHWSVGPYVMYHPEDIAFVAVLSLTAQQTCEDYSLDTWWRDSGSSKVFCATELEL